MNIPYHEIRLALTHTHTCTHTQVSLSFSLTLSLYIYTFTLAQIGITRIHAGTCDAYCTARQTTMNS